MSRSFVTNIQHFIHEKGAIPESMPRQARKLIENLGSIVACVTIQVLYLKQSCLVGIKSTVSTALGK